MSTSRSTAHSTGGSQSTADVSAGGSPTTDAVGSGAQRSTGGDASQKAADANGGPYAATDAQTSDVESAGGSDGAAALPEPNTVATGSLGAAAGAAGSAAGGASNATVEPDPYALPTTLPTVKLEVNEPDVQTLEADPFHAADVSGAFTDENGVRYERIDVNYRGAYALETLISDELPQRNWKLKFAKDQKYRNRRE